MPVLGLGVDAVAIDRMRRITTVAGRGDRFKMRVFTEGERSCCDARRDPAECYAVRFAAKEAVMKALGAEGVSQAWRDIEVVRSKGGAPQIRVHGRVAERCRDRGVRAIHVSLTHAEPMALAAVVLEG
ncbi:MAG TPA: holo-ACP synthase [Candidatus Binatia bacterium]|nr:holo-ACP synthase [Candidatus Binatia bacterium]